MKLRRLFFAAAVVAVAFAFTGCPGGDSRPSVNRIALAEAIEAAEALLDATEVSATGADVLPADYWAPQAAHDALDAAIDVARPFLQTGSQDQIDAAVVALENAYDVFYALRERGTYGLPPGVIRAELTEAIDAAKALLAVTGVSVDGTDVLPANHWTTQAVRNTFEGAVEAAEGVYGNAAATQAQVDTAVTTLTTAHGVFFGARALGTYGLPPGVIRTALADAIGAAEALLYATEVSIDGADVPPAEFWTTQAVRDTFEDAVEAAEGVYGNAAATQAQVDAALTTLTAAHGVFFAARALGRYGVPDGVDRSELVAAISAARSLLYATEVSVDGTDILPTEFWTTQAVHDTFEDAIEAAEAVPAAADQAAVDAATETLTAAHGVFNTARRLGTYGLADLDRDELDAAISAAYYLLGRTEVSADGNELFPTVYWTTEAVRDTFIAARDAAIYARAAAETQEEIDTATETLETAHGVFDTARVPGRLVTTFTITFEGPQNLLTAISAGPVLRDDPGYIEVAQTPMPTDIRWYRAGGQIGSGPSIYFTDIHQGQLGVHLVTVSANIGGLRYSRIISLSVVTELPTE